jgi:ArsR family transcriptional regulator
MRIRDKLSAMNASDDLTYMANLYMALADRTRLRILNLLRDGEVCVADFTEILGDSQPKISRHLAYLRNAGVVETRRDGKWMHYRINWPDDTTVQQVISAALISLSGRHVCMADTDRHTAAFRAAGWEASSSGRVELGDTYAEAYVVNGTMETTIDEGYASHNELDEFLH